MRQLPYVVLALLLSLVAAYGGYQLLAWYPVPPTIQYGVSFNTLYARELGLDWRETYNAILNDLQVKHLRLAAHWPMVEPEQGLYNFTELDYQVSEAKNHGADIVFGVGRRLPRWPECHVPDWAEVLSWEEQKQAIREYIEVVVTRYKDADHIQYWQVENEPFLTVFAREYCGELDTSFLDEEIAFVRSLDSSRPILVTDSGNLGTWYGAYKRGDVFGTSAYRYIWNPEVGPFESFLQASFYRAKANVMGILFGKKETILIELAAEPWLLEPVVDTPLDVQLTRMDGDKFDEIVEFGKDIRFEKQYLWGAEWWYWLHTKGNDSLWTRAQTLFKPEEAANE